MSYCIDLLNRKRFPTLEVQIGKLKMENGKWKMENGKWKMEMENGKFF